MIVSLALAQLLARCAPDVGPVTMSAIVFHESDARPFAIGDNTAKRSYSFGDRETAVALASRLLAGGHNIDVGYAQINSSNFDAYGLNVSSAFDPCTNLAVGSRILRGDYARAIRWYGPGQTALAHALSAYNSGSYWSGLAYARAVALTAARLRFLTETRGPAAARPGEAIPFRRSGSR